MWFNAMHNVWLPSCGEQNKLHPQNNMGWRTYLEHEHYYSVKCSALNIFSVKFVVLIVFWFFYTCFLHSFDSICDHLC